jgi:hypothetical protein
VVSLRRRITVTSSLNETSTDHLGNGVMVKGGGGVDRYLKTTSTGLPPPPIFALGSLYARAVYFRFMERLYQGHPRTKLTCLGQRIEPAGLPRRHGGRAPYSSKELFEQRVNMYSIGNICI